MLTVGNNEVAEALENGGAVVALETAVLTHGLPRPQNLAAVQLMAEAVRAGGATPAVIAVHEGRIVVGMRDDHLEQLAYDDNALKVGARDLAVACANASSAGTTVSGTLAVCKLAGISVFATGGIGGVHRGWEKHRDISSDLAELANTQCCVVSAGAKSVLDLPATLESLESLQIPVLGFQTDYFPQFHSRGSAELLVPHRVDSSKHCAMVCANHWGALNRDSGVLLANPVPTELAFEQAEINALVKEAVAQAELNKIGGQQLTPFLLDHLATATDSRSIATNIALLCNNAKLAGELAVELGALFSAEQ